MQLDVREAEVFLARCVLSREFAETPPAGLLLQAPNFARLKAWALSEAEAMLKIKRVTATRSELEARLRVALHLCPPAAIEYDPRSTLSRKTLVAAYIEREYGVSRQAAHQVARSIAMILDAWEARRTTRITQLHDHLLSRQGGRCACCRLPFNDERRREEEESLASNGADLFKPYFDGDGVVERMRPVIDHLRAISNEGTNAHDNLQILCCLCNLGKSDGLGIDIGREFKFAARSPADVDEFHRMQLLFYRLTVDNSTCTICGGRSLEMTVRKISSEASTVLTNLRTLCRSCIHLS